MTMASTSPTRRKQRFRLHEVDAALRVSGGVYAHAAKLLSEATGRSCTRQGKVPMYLSAVFPKGVALCGEIADGIILTRSTLRTAASVRVQLAEAAHRVGRDPAKIEVTSLLPTSVGDTREAALATLRPGLAFYAGFFPRYNRMMADA